MAKRVAVIDIGSNSVRLVVFEKTSRFAFHLLNESKSRVRLSQNVYQNDGNLQEDAMQRTIDTLRDFKGIASSYKVRKTLCVATSALRDAPNKKEFIQRVKKELQLNIKVIDGKKEAYLGAIACANLLPTQKNAISIDIGGGSTELALIDEKNVTTTFSINLGTVRLKELFYDSNKKEDLIKYIDEKLQVLDNLNISTIIGIGGTFRAISSAILKNSNYPLNKIHAFSYTNIELDNFIALLLKADEKELKSLGIKNERFDIIKPGAIILQRVLAKLSIQNVMASGVGVREGVYLSDLLRGAKDRFPTHYNTSVKYILDAHVDDKDFSNQLSHLCKKIFDITHEHLNISKEYRKDLSIAAKLYPSGNSIHFFSKNKHSYYLIQSALEYGFTHSQITLIATLCNYAKRKLPSVSHVQKYAQLLPDTKTLNELSYIISLSISLLSHRPRNIDFELKFNDGVLSVESNKPLRLSKEAVNKLSTIKNLRIDF